MLMGRIGQTLRENGVASGNIMPEMLELMMRRLLETDRETRSSECQPTTHAPHPRSDFNLHLWRDGRFHRLPEDYVWPKMSTLQGWMLWWEGKTSLPLGFSNPQISLCDGDIIGAICLA